MASVKRNAVYNIAYQFLTLALPLITTPVVSRALGTYNLGIYSYSFSVASFFVLFANLGIANYGNRSIAKVRDNKKEVSSVFWQIFDLQFVLSAAATALFILAVLFFWGYSNIFLIWIFYLLSSILDINWFFFGLEKFSLTVSRNLVIKLLSLICIVFLVHGTSALYIYTLIMSLSFFLSNVPLWFFLKDEVVFVLPHIKEIISHLRPALTLFVPIVAVSIYTSIDKILLGSISNMHQSGLFENAFKIAQLPSTLIAALGSAVLPRVANVAAKGNINKVNWYLKVSVWISLIVAYPMMFGLMGISHEFAPLFLGDAFASCWIIISIISLDLPFIVLATVLRMEYLVPLERDMQYISSVLAGAIVNLAINVLLIPPLGAVGAAIGTCVAEIAVCIVQIVELRDQLPILSWCEKTLPFFAMSALMLIAIFLVKQLLKTNLIGLLIETSIGILSFIGLFSVYFFIKGGKDVCILALSKLIKHR